MPLSSLSLPLSSLSFPFNKPFKPFKPEENNPSVPLFSVFLTVGFSDGVDATAVDDVDTEFTAVDAVSSDAFFSGTLFVELFAIIFINCFSAPAGKRSISVNGEKPELNGALVEFIEGYIYS